MPQLDFATYASQIFWLAVTFAALYYVLASFSLPRVREVLQNRQDRVRGDLEKADSLKHEAEQVESDYEEALKKARSRAHELLAETQKNLQVEAEKRHAHLDDTFTRQNKETEARITLLKKEAAKELGVVSEEVAASIAKKLAGIDVSKDQAQKAREKLRKAS